MTQRSAHCLNCGAPTPDEFCSRCGQKNADYREGLRELVGEVAQELLQLDSRIGHTIVPFLFQPGKLTVEWAAGKRTHYSSPLRIFLLVSVAYFFTLSMTTHSDRYVAVDEHGIRFEAVEVPDGGARDGGVPDDARDASAAIDDDDDGGDRGSADGGDRGSTDGGVSGSRPQRGPKLDETSLLWRLRHSRFGPKDAETPRERADRLLGFLLSAASKVVFLLMPLFALLVHALFFRSRRFYVEHLVFSVHVHSFVLVLLLVGMVPLPTFLPCVAIGFVYLGAALRRVYRPTIFQLAWKVLVLLFAYLLLIGLVVVAVALAAFGFA